MTLTRISIPMPKPRHPEARAKRASKDERPQTGPSSFETRFALQDDGDNCEDAAATSNSSGFNAHHSANRCRLRARAVALVDIVDHQRLEVAAVVAAQGAEFLAVDKDRLPRTCLGSAVRHCRHGEADLYQPMLTFFR